MKKVISIIAILAILIILTFAGNCYAASLDTIDVKIEKTTVKPGEEVKVSIEFGQELGSYTFNISYDNNIFDYVSSEGGTAHDTTDKVKVVYYDSTGGSNPRSNMSVTFRAKADITTSNPTEFTITAEGLANADASVTFDDITIPIIKNVTVEPQYVDYTLKLEHTGNLIKGEENQMTLSYSSPMGRYYEHARLIAEATTPTGANVRLLATDQAGLEHDIIESGWGDAQGYKIGGKDVSQVLQVRGIFSKVGDYTITLKLIDRDNSDQVISEETFKFTVQEVAQTTPPITNPDNTETEVPGQVIEDEKVETPSNLPHTGINIYIPIIAILAILISSYIFFNRKNNYFNLD